jgi:hypothetical protein
VQRIGVIKGDYGFFKGTTFGAYLFGFFIILFILRTRLVDCNRSCNVIAILKE